MPMDLVRVETRNQILFSFLSVGWGLIADIDIESERLRAIGGQRFTVWSVARLIGLRTYKGKISYVPCNRVPPMENGNGKICRKECATESTLSHSRSYGDELDRYVHLVVSNRYTSACYLLSDWHKCAKLRPRTKIVSVVVRKSSDVVKIAIYFIRSKNFN